MNGIQGPRGRGPGLVIALGCAALLCAVTSCRDQAPQPLLLDHTAESGLDFVHFNGMSGERYFSEVVGAGVALFDADGDDDLDLFFVQGAMLGPGKTLDDALQPPPHPPQHDRIYRNLLREEGELRFVDATEGSGLEAATGYGMGVAAGDVDNDGDIDLYVTHAGPDRLWLGRGDGTFEDATEKAGLAGDDRWSTSAAFLDVDRDGWLDLYVAYYVDYRPETHKGCLDSGGAPEYCGPHSYAPETDRLWRNRGDGTFEDFSERAGLLTEAASGLGVVTGDLNGDRHLDVYVANDLMRNLLWLGRGDGTFENQALLAGAAVGLRGQAEASMGVDAGDVDNDGDLDLFMTHLDGETNTVYLGNGEGQFQDATARLGLAEPSRANTGFGTALADLDNDGWLDVVVANGAVKSLPAQRLAGEVLPLRQPNQLYLSDRQGGFVDATARAPAFLEPEVSRGLAVGDLDEDGDLDVVVTANGGPARLLLNTAGQDASWIGLRLVERTGRAPHGALVRFDFEGREVVRRAGPDASYCSARDPRLLLGLGTRREPVSLRVEWPTGEAGHSELFDGLEPGRYHVLRQGSGRPAAGAGP